MNTRLFISFEDGSDPTYTGAGDCVLVSVPAQRGQKDPDYSTEDDSDDANPVNHSQASKVSLFPSNALDMRKLGEMLGFVVQVDNEGQIVFCTGVNEGDA